MSRQFGRPAAIPAIRARAGVLGLERGEHAFAHRIPRRSRRPPLGLDVHGPDRSNLSLHERPASPLVIRQALDAPDAPQVLTRFQYLIGFERHAHGKASFGPVPARIDRGTERGRCRVARGHHRARSDRCAHERLTPGAARYERSRRGKGARERPHHRPPEQSARVRPEPPQGDKSCERDAAERHRRSSSRRDARTAGEPPPSQLHQTACDRELREAPASTPASDAEVVARGVRHRHRRSFMFSNFFSPMPLTPHQVLKC